MPTPSAFLRTLKEELVWLNEWTSPAVFFAALERWIADYAQGYLPSALGYRAPATFEAEHLSLATPLPEPLGLGAAPAHGAVSGRGGVPVPGGNKSGRRPVASGARPSAR